MQNKSDAQLLREYAAQHSEPAFAEIVARHTDLVYSAALRQTGSPELALEIAQSVFTDLARKAREELGDSATKETGRGVREPGRAAFGDVERLGFWLLRWPTTLVSSLFNGWWPGLSSMVTSQSIHRWPLRSLVCKRLTLSPSRQQWTRVPWTMQWMRPCLWTKGTSRSASRSTSSKP
jgi:hypothetical protein